MIDTNRVFITGYGALTASGMNAEDTWSAILEGQTGVREISQWDISSWPCKLGAEIPVDKLAKLLPDRKLMKVISRQDVFGINAAQQAIEHSGLLPYRDSLDNADLYNDKTGVYVGSPGNKYYQQYDFLPLLEKSQGQMKPFAEQLFSEVHPMWLLRILPNNVLAYTGILNGFKGQNHNVTNHAVGGLQALLEAYHAVRTGVIERAVVVAYDVGTEPQALFYYDKLGLISYKHLKPFDSEHDGTLLAEGAAAVVIESEASAAQRQATCYAEISGGLTTSEASGLFSIDEGEGLADMLATLCETTELEHSQLGMIVAHGNGNPKSDRTEAKALHSLFGPSYPAVTGFKWSTGHTLCASGIVDTVLATKALNEKQIPGVFNFEKPAPGCEHLNLSAQHRPLSDDKPYALILNRGFGSMNAGMVIKRCD